MISRTRQLWIPALAFAATTGLSAVLAEEHAGARKTVFGDWTVVIAPLNVSADAPAEDEADLPEVAPQAAVEAEGEPAREHAGPAGDRLRMASLYGQIYESIPFQRSPHEVNPAYRHDATMEILFGELRPTVIHRHAPPNYDPPSGTIDFATRVPYGQRYYPSAVVHPFGFYPSRSWYRWHSFHFPLRPW